MALIEVVTRARVATLRFNSPKKLNAWSQPMLREKRSALAALAKDDAIDAVILTGTGKYYSAGVDLAAVLRPMHPRKLVDIIEVTNRELFEQFIDFPKPLFVAMNGPAIGATVTSATLSDGVIASSRATLHTPFKALGLPAEGCSSYLFPKLMGPEVAHRMLEEGFKMEAPQALELGIFSEIVDSEPSDGADEKLLEATQRHAEAYVAKHGVVRSVSPEEAEKRREVNIIESRKLAEAFVSAEFFRAMEANADRKGNTPVKLGFKALRLSRPLWSSML